MNPNYDITIQSSNGEVTFKGRKRDGSKFSILGYEPPLEGFGDPGRRTTSTPKSGADGGIIVARDQQYEIRQIPIQAFAMCQTQAEIDDVRSGIAQSLPIREDVSVFLDRPDGKRFGLTAVISKAAPSIPYADGPKLIQDWSIELLASDPNIYDYTSGTENEIELSKGILGGLLWDEDGLHWEADGLYWESGGGDTTVTNGGTETVYPRIEMTGVSHNPSFTNVTTGKVVALNISTVATDVVVIDMNRETVTLNGANIINNVTSRQWWGLAPGTNRIRYDSISPDDSAVPILKWRNAYIAVV